ncbi:metalloendopeptidase OMA1, mitochondrial [Osmerus eperlanus]|uniref:metalloendopeptidase OMA1, mitochondrial n=1 Tax=Osmerus eperlanus TaxID=29151 RepID=UPI002E13D07E
MELLCVRLITRRNPIISLPTYVKRRFRGLYRQTELTVKSPLLSSIELSGKSCRTTDSVRDLVCQLPRCQPRPSLLISTRTGLLPAKNPLTTLPTHGSVSLPRHFHTSSPLRAIPAPLLWLILKPLQKILAIIVGRNIRKWWADLPPNRRQLFWEGVWRRRWQLVAGTTVAVAILAVILLTHLDESPVTGRTRILMVTREDYMELAAITADGYMEQYRDVLVPEQDSRHQAVQMMVQHLALRNRDISQMSSVSWRVHVVDDPAVNAFVLPNGEVFMFTGMLEAISDVHQLAIILGHEMAHALIEHAAEEASVSHILDFLFVLLLTAIWAVCPRDSLAVLGQWIQDQLKKILFSRPYSRKLETEADEVGLHLAAKACADVRAGPVLWQQMELRGGAAVPEWLSTHPSHSSRATHINSLVPQWED